MRKKKNSNSSSVRNSDGNLVEKKKKKFEFEFGPKFALIRLNSFEFGRVRLSSAEFGLVRFGFVFQTNSEFESDRTGYSKKACDRFGIFTVFDRFHFKFEIIDFLF